MGKKLYGIIIALFILVSIGMGMISYQCMMNTQKTASFLEQFQWVIPLGTDYFAFGRNEKARCFTAIDKKTFREAVFDQNGKIIATGESLFVDEDFYVYEEDGLQGIKDNWGKVLIPAAFECINTFDGKYGQATIKGDKEIAFNQRGDILYSPLSKETSLWQVKGPLFRTDINGLNKVIDVETGKTVFESAEYSGISYIGEGYYSAYTGEGSEDTDYKILLNEDFEPVLNGQRFKSISEFRQGYCYVERVEEMADVTNGYIDKSGKVTIKLDGNLYGGDFSEDKAIVYYKDKLCCINLKGEVLFKLPVEMGKKQEYGYPMFHRGKAAVSIGDKAGLVNETGEWIIPPDFDDVGIIGRNLVSIGQKDKWGVIKIGRRGHVNQSN